MTTPSIPKQDTVPRVIRKMAEEWLYRQAEDDREFAALLHARPCECCGGPECECPIDYEWIDALAGDLDGAISDRLIEWLRTLKEGRPPTEYVVEWEHRELVDIEDAKEIAANQGHRYG